MANETIRESIRSEAFKFLRDYFPKLSEAKKVKARIFVDPQIKEKIDNEELLKLLSNGQKKLGTDSKQ